MNKMCENFNETIAPWIGKTGKMMHLYMNGIFSQHDFNLTKEQWIVLKILQEGNPEGIVQNELALVTDRNKGTLTRLINVMEKNKLVKRIPSKKDSRKNLIVVTAHGQSLFQKTRPILLEHIKIIEDGLTSEEKEQFISIAKKIQENLKKQYS